MLVEVGRIMEVDTLVEEDTLVDVVIREDVEDIKTDEIVVDEIEVGRTEDVKLDTTVVDEIEVGRTEVVKLDTTVDEVDDEIEELLVAEGIGAGIETVTGGELTLMIEYFVAVAVAVLGDKVTTIVFVASGPSIVFVVTI